MTTKEKQPLFQRHDVAAATTAEKTTFLPFLCLSFHLEAVSAFIFSDLRIIILEFQTVWEILGGGNVKEKYSPLPHQPALMCLERDEIPELLHLSCSENFGCTWQVPAE